MSCRRKLLILAGALLVLTTLLIGAVIKLAPRAQQAFFYPKPKGMPAAIPTPMPELLARLETVLQAKAPKTAAALQPGLTPAQIAALEAKGGLQLSPDLRALYAWRNGIPAAANLDFIPGHDFPPLEDAIQTRTALQTQVNSMSPTQRTSFHAFAGHRLPWLGVVVDAAGDGYFYDPLRPESEGSYFFNFAEVGMYVWFPSFRNFLGMTIENYETGIYTLDSDGVTLKEDQAKSVVTWQKYGEMGAMGGLAQ